MKRYEEDILKIPIQDFLEGMGIPTRKEGNKLFASSPFSSDRNWSFCIYPTNTFFDFSSGCGGNILNLVSRLHGISFSEAARRLRDGISHETYKPNYKNPRPQQEPIQPFDYEKYINTNPEECAQIKAYAASRGITEGYFCGVFFTRQVVGKEHSGWLRNPSLAFLHVDKYLKPCGAKFRKIKPTEDSRDQSVRFSSRGALGFYILETNPNAKPTQMYVVESESSANSLWEYLKIYGIVTENYVVLSRGGVSSAPKLEELPEIYQSLPKKVIIDYDGSEELYQKRLKLYAGLLAQPIRLILPKGEDINSLYVHNKMWMIEHLLLE
jgi:hypothetical protein